MNIDPNGLKKAVRKLVPFAGKKEASEAIEAYIVRNRLRLRRDLEVGVEPAELWRIDQPRAIGRLSHGWFFLRGFYTAFNDLTDGQRETVADLVVRLLQEWRALDHDRYEMAYHDETTAMRVINIIGFINEAKGFINPAQLRETAKFLSDELELLANPGFYGGINNHGMFQDFALITGVAHGFAGSDVKGNQFLQLAFSRLQHYLMNCFTVDGIHTENSPSYHLMVSRYLGITLDLARSAGALEQFESMAGVLESADLYAAFCLSPTGKFVPISDTAPHRIALHSAQSAYGDGFLAYVVSDGELGRRPAQRIFQAKESGYFVAHSVEEQRERQNYLFFSSAYNADYHKHSDELSFYFVLDQHELIREAGPNGYEYSDPYTKFAYSSRAHNTLLVDGMGLSRVDSNADKTWMHHAVQDEGTNSFSVVGETHRYSGVKWRRAISSSDASKLENLVVTDSVESSSPHEYTFVWHFGREIDPENLGHKILLRGHDQATIGTLSWVAPIEPTIRLMHGSEGKPLQGWQFPKMGVKQKSWAVEFSFQSVRNLVVTWTVGKEITSLRPSHIGLQDNSSALLTRGLGEPMDVILVGTRDDDVPYVSDLASSMDSSGGRIFSINTHNSFEATKYVEGSSVLSYEGVTPEFVIDLIGGRTETVYVLAESEKDYIKLHDGVRMYSREWDGRPYFIVLAADTFGDNISSENFGNGSGAVMHLKLPELRPAFSRLVRSAAAWSIDVPESPLPHTVFEKSGEGRGFGIFVPDHLYTTATAELYKNGKPTGSRKRLVKGSNFWGNLQAGEYRARIRWNDASDEGGKRGGAFGSWRLPLL